MGEYADDAIEEGFEELLWRDDIDDLGLDFPNDPLEGWFRRRKSPPRMSYAAYHGDSCRDPNCTGHFVTRKNRKDGSRFMGCSQYPKCKMTAAELLYVSSAGMACRDTQCEGKLVVRTNRTTGETFLGCTRFPKCRVIAHEAKQSSNQEA